MFHEARSQKWFAGFFFPAGSVLQTKQSLWLL